MRPDGSLVGTRWGTTPAIQPQPRRRRRAGARDGAPARPWGSRRLPRTLEAGDPRRTLVRTLLRHAEGVPVDFADGGAGVVDQVVFPALGYDFWPSALVVATPEGARVVSRERIGRLDLREPRIVVAARRPAAAVAPDPALPPSVEAPAASTLPGRRATARAPRPSAGART